MGLAADRPAVTKREDGKWSVRPSEFGKCIRGLVAAAVGKKPEPFTEDSLRIMNEGHLHEGPAVQEWEKRNGGFVQRHVELELPLGPNMVVEGTCDGMWWPDDEEKSESDDTDGIEPVESSISVYGVEVKASDDGMFEQMRKNGPTLTYLWQISVYWAAMEYMLGFALRGFVFLQRRRKDGLIASRIFDKPPFSLEQVLERGAQLEGYLDMGDDGFGLVSCDRKDFFCNWWRYHEGFNEKSEYDEEPAECAMEYYKLGAEIDSLKYLQAAKKEDLDAVMRGRQKIRTKGFSLFYGSRDGVDEEAIKLAHPELVERFRKFDLDACLDQNPELREQYKIPGRRFLTVSPNKKELGDDYKTKKPRAKGVGKVTDEQMEKIEGWF